MTSPTPSPAYQKGMIELTLVDIECDVENDVAFCTDKTETFFSRLKIDNSSYNNNRKNVVKRNIQDVVPKALQHCVKGRDVIPSLLPTATTLKSWSTANKFHDDGETRERMVQSIMRYLRIQDKYTALTSTLLKSRAFYQSHHTEVCRRQHQKGVSDCKEGEQKEEEEEEEEKEDFLPGGGTHLPTRPSLPIVELPRTKYNKPFIPTRQRRHHSDVSPNENNAKLGLSSKGVLSDSIDAHGKLEEEEDKEEEVNAYPISISHQYPFVAIARLIRPTSSLFEQQEQESISLVQKHHDFIRVGLDVVTFDDFNPNLYETTDEYLKVFQSSFSDWEWDRILRTQKTKPMTLGKGSSCREDSSSSIARKSHDDGIRSGWSKGFLLKSRTGRGGNGGATGRNKQKKQPSTLTSPRTDPEKIREFYLRWSMKESYTKALGLGMGLEFDCFETKLMGIDCVDDSSCASVCASSENKGARCLPKKNNDGDGSASDGTIFYNDVGIWGALMRNSGNERNDGSAKFGFMKVRGKVSKNFQSTSKAQNRKDKPAIHDEKDEHWDFYFLALHSQDGSTTPPDHDTVVGTLSKNNEEESYSMGKDPYKGCACVCVGPLPKSGEAINDIPQYFTRDGNGVLGSAVRDDSSALPIVEWKTLSDLICYHDGKALG